MLGTGDTNEAPALREPRAGGSATDWEAAWEGLFILELVSPGPSSASQNLHPQALSPLRRWGNKARRQLGSPQQPGGVGEAEFLG